LRISGELGIIADDLVTSRADPELSLRRHQPVTREARADVTIFAALDAAFGRGVPAYQNLGTGEVH